MAKKDLTGLLLLIALFLLLRVSILFFSFDNIYADADELSRGALAKEMINGPMLPILDYPEADSEVYEGGRLFASFLTAPLFVIFGDSYFSLKLTAVLCSLFCLIFWFIFLLKFFGRRTAFIWSLLFILSPPLYTQASLVTWGAHAEYYFFAPVFFIFLFAILYANRIEEVKNKIWVVFGLLSGLSIWIIQNNIIAVVTCFLCIFIVDRKFFFRKQFGIYLLSFVLGYSPGIYHFFTRHWQYSIGCDSIFKLYPRSGVSNWLPKLKALLVDFLPKSFIFKQEIISYIYFFIFLSAFLFMIWVNRKIILKIVNNSISARLPYEFPLLFYLLVYLLAYTFGGLSVWEDDEGYLKYKYVTIIYPVIFFVIAFMVNRLWNNKTKFICIALSGFLLVTGLQANIGMISFKNFKAPLKEPGFSYFELGDRISGGRTIRGIKEVLKHIRWINPQYGPDFLTGMAAGMGFNRAINEDVPGILDVFNKIPPKYQEYLYKGWGIGLNDILFSDLPVGIRRLELILPRIPLRYKNNFYAGLGEGVITNFVLPLDVIPVLESISLKAEPLYLPDLYSGVSKGLLNYDKKDRAIFIQNYIDIQYQHLLIDNVKTNP